MGRGGILVISATRKASEMPCESHCPLPVSRALVRLLLRILSSLSRHKDFS